MEEASPFRRCALIGSTASRVVSAAGLGALVVAPLAAASHPFLGPKRGVRAGREKAPQLSPRASSHLDLRAAGVVVGAGRRASRKVALAHCKRAGRMSDRAMTDRHDR